MNGHSKGGRGLTLLANAQRPRAPKAEEHVTPQRVERSMQMRFSPIRALSPELLSGQLDQYARGYISPIMRMWDAMERRDDRLSAVAPKAKSSLARHGFEVIAIDDSAAAKQHKEALEYFYNNLTVEEAFDGNDTGGFSMLVRTMADSIGFRWAVHEILWQPSMSGLTAVFRHAPTWFFENLTGKLRFLQQDFDFYGIDMDPEQWLVTAGPGIDEACSVAYMFKHLPLKDWLAYSEKFGFPGILGKTTAAANSEQWKAMVDAVRSFANDFAAVCNSQDAIELVKADGGTTLPFPPIIQAMDAAMSILWRGADLSTQSHGAARGEGTGASLQEDETALLDEDRAQRIGETLNIQIDRRVIQYTFGVEPLAYIKLKTKPRRNVTQDLQVIQALAPMGVPFAVADVLERMGFAMPDDGEELLTAPAVPAPIIGSQPFGNIKAGAGTRTAPPEKDPDFARFLANGVRLTQRAKSEDMAPLRAAVEHVLAAPDDAELRIRAAALDRDFPQIAEQIGKSVATAKVLYGLSSAAAASTIAAHT